MAQKNLEKYKAYVAKRLGDLSPFLVKYAMGDFSQKIDLPKEEDEFTELLVALNLMVDDVRSTMDEKEKTIAALQRAEKELQRRWEQFLAIINNFPEILYIVDHETYQVIFVNQAFEDALGEDPVGKLCYQAFQGFDAPCEFCTNQIILEERKPYTWEYYNPSLDRHYFITDQIIKWPDGRDVRFETAIDISDRKEAEQELSVKNRAIESALSAIALADLEGNLTYVNPAFLEIWGYGNEAEVLGRQATEFWQMAEKAAQVMGALQQEGSWLGELTATRKDGSVFDVQVAASMVMDEEGVPLHMMASFIDITDRIQTEKELAQRVTDLERFNRLAVGRENRMIDLKKEVNALAEELGREAPYDVAFA